MPWPRRGGSGDEEQDTDHVGLLGDDAEPPAEGGPSNVWSRVFGNRYEALPTEERISPHLLTEAVRPSAHSSGVDESLAAEEEDELGELQEAPAQPLDPRELLRHAMLAAQGVPEERVEQPSPPQPQRPKDQPQPPKQVEARSLSSAAADAELQRLQREWQREAEEQARRDEELARRLQQEWEQETPAVAAPSPRTSCDDEGLARRLQRELELEAAGARAQQAETDEELARRLQAEFDGEGAAPSPPPPAFLPPAPAPTLPNPTVGLPPGQPYHWSTAHHAFQGSR